MPTYEYICTECSTPLEVVQSFTDDALTECPACQGRLRKVFGNVGVSFKGSGFYKTDSRTVAKSPTGTSSSDAKSSDASSSESSSSSSETKSSEMKGSESKGSDSSSGASSDKSASNSSGTGSSSTNTSKTG